MPIRLHRHRAEICLPRRLLGPLPFGTRPGCCPPGGEERGPLPFLQSCRSTCGGGWQVACSAASARVEQFPSEQPEKRVATCSPGISLLLPGRSTPVGSDPGAALPAGERKRPLPYSAVLPFPPIGEVVAGAQRHQPSGCGGCPERNGPEKRVATQLLGHIFLCLGRGSTRASTRAASARRAGEEAPYHFCSPPFHLRSGW